MSAMDTFSSVRSSPISLSHSVESQVYGYFALAMALTLLGTYLGVHYATQLLGGGFLILFVIAELAIVLTSR